MQSGGQSKAWGWRVGLSVEHTAQWATQWAIHPFLSIPQTLPLGTLLSTGRLRREGQLGSIHRF